MSFDKAFTIGGESIARENRGGIELHGLGGEQTDYKTTQRMAGNQVFDRGICTYSDAGANVLDIETANMLVMTKGPGNAPVLYSAMLDPTMIGLQMTHQILTADSRTSERGGIVREFDMGSKKGRLEGSAEAKTQAGNHWFAVLCPYLRSDRGNRGLIAVNLDTGLRVESDAVPIDVDYDATLSLFALDAGKDGLTWVSVTDGRRVVVALMDPRSGACVLRVRCKIPGEGNAVVKSAFLTRSQASSTIVNVRTSDRDPLVYELPLAQISYDIPTMDIERTPHAALDALRNNVVAMAPDAASPSHSLALVDYGYGDRIVKRLYVD